MTTITFRCNKHPKYKAIHPPRSVIKGGEPCYACWNQFTETRARTLNYPDGSKITVTRQDSK